MDWLERVVKEAQVKFGKIPDCSAYGHPFPERIVRQFQPGRNVFVQCTNCNGFYERRPTAEELQSYSNMLKMEVRALTT